MRFKRGLILKIFVYTAGAIPVGIAVARQRLQEHAQHQQQPKDLNRFGIGIATDLGEWKFSLFLCFFFVYHYDCIIVYVFKFYHKANT